MITLTRAADMAIVAGALVERLAGDRPADRLAGLFETSRVIVPNRTVETYLRLRLADAFEIAAGVEFLRLEEFLVGLARPLADRHRVLDTERLQALLVGVLSDETFLGRPGLEPVVRYIDRAAEGDGRDERRLQLASQLARLYTEYVLGRPAWLADWEAGVASGPGAPTARWQRAIWRRLAGPNGVLDGIARRRGVRWTTLPRLLGTVPPTDLELPAAVDIVLATPPARALSDVIARLGEAVDVRLYLVDPVGPAPRDRLVERWRRPDRDEFARAMVVAGATLDDRPPAADRPPATRLARLQRELATGQPAGPGAPGPGDRSIAVLSATGIGREVEAIAGTIWEALADPTFDPPLRVDQVAVFLCGPRADEYQAQIRSVFRDLHGLPYSMSGVGAAAESRVLEAVGLLLDLPLGTWTRPEFLTLVTHPAVAGRFDEVDPDEWIAWASQLSVLFGADRTDLDGTYIERDLYSWDQGLRRLVLGTFLGPGDEPYEADGQLYLPLDVGEDRMRAAGDLVLLVRALVADARACRSALRPLSRWAGVLADLVAATITPVGPDDERVLDRCLDRLAGLAAVDLDGRPVGYRVARLLAAGRLEGLTTTRGVRHPEGVVVATPEAVRPLGFRMVVRAGLGEGQYPAGEPADALDLRLLDRGPWDVPPRERDRDRFLEAVLTTSDRLVLSHVGSDDATGDAIDPSSLVRELLARVDGRADLVDRRPLRRFEERPDRIVPPAARREAAAIALRRALVGPDSSADLDLAAVVAAVGPELRPALEETLALCPVPAEPVARPPDRGRLGLSIAQLRRFLECPLQGSTDYHLRLPDEESDDLLVVDEPFTLSRPIAAGLLRRIFLAARRRRGKNALESVLAAETERAELAGQLPTGLFGRVERAVCRDQLHGWGARLSEAGISSSTRLSVLQFGRAREDAIVDESLDPILVDASWTGPDGIERQAEVEVSGATGPSTDRASTVLVVRPGPIGRDFLRPYLDWICLAASGRTTGRPFEGVVAGRDKGRRVRFRPLSEWRANEWLQDVVGDLLSGIAPIFLPFEAIDRAMAPGPRQEPVSVVEAAETLRRGSRTSHSSSFGRVRHPEDFPVPDADAVRRIVARRFGLFYDRPGKRS